MAHPLVRSAAQAWCTTQSGQISPPIKCWRARRLCFALEIWWRAAEAAALPVKAAGIDCRWSSKLYVNYLLCVCAPRMCGSSTRSMELTAANRSSRIIWDRFNLIKKLLAAFSQNVTWVTHNCCQRWWYTSHKAWGEKRSTYRQHNQFKKIKRNNIFIQQTL